MKTKLILLYAAIFGMVFTGCGDDDDNTPMSKVPETCQQAFEAKYPTVTNGRWERERGYYKVEWKENNGMVEKEAWFKATGPAAQSWAMTVTDYGKDLFLVPTALNVAFQATEYSTQTIEDIDYYEYPDDSSNVYVIEVEDRKSDVETLVIFKGSDCSFLKAVPDNDVDITPDTVF